MSVIVVNILCSAQAAESVSDVLTISWSRPCDWFAYGNSCSWLARFLDMTGAADERQGKDR